MRISAINKSVMKHRTLALVLVSEIFCSAPWQRAAAADPAWTTSIVEEDDYWTPGHQDRHYTHGVRLSTTTGDLDDTFWRAPFSFLGNYTPLFAEQTGPDIARRYNIIILGQNMYTPEDWRPVNPDRHDWPFAGWLYSGIGLMQDTRGESFEELDLKLGLVGPGSLAQETQTKYHLLINVQPFNGWHAQLHNEPTLDLYYAQKRRFELAATPDDLFGLEVLPEAGLRVGNVYDYVSAGAVARLGANLKMDYGPPHIDMNSGADYINPTRAVRGDVGGYVFAGALGRLVARNMFLDGNAFKSSPRVPKIPAVGDFEGGFALLYQHWRLAYTYVFRTHEFVHESGYDHYGSLNLTFGVGF
jgi:lipid A 3-O-deacylase